MFKTNVKALYLMGLNKINMISFCYLSANTILDKQLKFFPKKQLLQLF